jgi:hypothetical protein
VSLLLWHWQALVRAADSELLWPNVVGSAEETDAGDDKNRQLSGAVIR